MFSKLVVFIALNALFCYGLPVSNFEVDRVSSDAVFKDLEEKVSQVNTKVERSYEVPSTQSPQELQEARHQALNAHYSFSTNVDDNILGSLLQQVEERKGGKVYGKYSYDDGNNFVTRYYIADENGFRVVKEIVAESAKKGARRTGLAVVTVSRDGHQSGYAISESDIKNCSPGHGQVVAH